MEIEFELVINKKNEEINNIKKEFTSVIEDLQYNHEIKFEKIYNDNKCLKTKLSEIKEENIETKENHSLQITELSNNYEVQIDILENEIKNLKMLKTKTSTIKEKRKFSD